MPLHTVQTAVAAAWAAHLAALAESGTDSDVDEESEAFGLTQDSALAKRPEWINSNFAEFEEFIANFLVGAGESCWVVLDLLQKWISFPVVSLIHLCHSMAQQ